jgi:serine/threonine protein kinase
MQVSSEDYIKGKLLGGGTWGDVYLGTRKADGRKVAIKRLKPRNVDSGLNFTGLREIKYLKAVKSPYVVDVSRGAFLK